MRILACSLTYPLPNGVTSSINESIDGFQAAGHDLRIVSPNYGTGKARSEHYYAQASTIGKAFTGYFFGKGELMFGLGASGEIKKIIHDFQPEAFWLHTLTWAPSAFERVVMKSRQPKVLTYHTLVDFYAKIYAPQLGGRLGGDQAVKQMIRRSVEVCNDMSRVIVPSHFVAKKLIGWGVTTPIAVIPTGINPVRGGLTKAELAKKFGFSASAPVLLFVGRVVQEKNIAALFQVMVKLRKVQPKAMLVLVGPGEIDEMKAEAEKLGILPNVVFTGELPLAEARRCYRGADIFVFASQSETQGIVVGEAMSAGLPVAALDSPVAGEVYPAGTAVTVKNPTQMADAVVDLLAHPEKAATLAAAGQKFVHEKFSKELMIRKQVKVFEGLLH